LRTWEAALALSEFLLLTDPPAIVAGSTRVLELGAGTGLVAMVSARMGAAGVVATDGDAGVCEALCANVRVNSLEERIQVEVRKWAGVREVPEPVGLVVGADVVGFGKTRGRRGAYS
jgi:predicted nicotinamide N-methyase